MILRRRRRMLGTIGILALSAFGAASAQAQLPVEPTPNVKTLPADYPDDWVFLVDGNFFGIESGKVVIADVGAEVDQYIGSLGLAQFGFFAQATTRNELYAVETFYSRGARGDRTDVLTIYDTATLLPKGEVVLPGGKRAQTLTEQGMFQLSHDERFAYVFNFTPAASVTIVDLVDRKIVGDVDVPGCTHAFALGGGGFASLCGNGAIVSTRLDEAGRVVSQTMSEPFQDIDEDPLYTRPAFIDGVAYFPSYGGRIQPIDFRGEAAEIGEAWTLSAPAEEGKKRLFGLLKSKTPPTYSPSGWQLVTSDDAGRLYVLMRKNALPGDHDTGGDEVWVFDPETHERVQRIELRADAHIIEVTGGEDPYLVAFLPDMSFDVFKANSGEWVRRIGGMMVMTPFAAYGAE